MGGPLGRCVVSSTPTRASAGASSRGTLRSVLHENASPWFNPQPPVTLFSSGRVRAIAIALLSPSFIFLGDASSRRLHPVVNGETSHTAVVGLEAQSFEIIGWSAGRSRRPATRFPFTTDHYARNVASDGQHGGHRVDRETARTVLMWSTTDSLPHT
jgi:hypothetical protein